MTKLFCDNMQRQINPPTPPFSKGGKGGFACRESRIVLIAAAITTTIILLFPVIAHARKAPEWINGTSAKYPTPQYFIGIGTAAMGKGGEKQQLQWASDRARAEIAKTLRVNVDVITHAERTVSSRQEGKEKEIEGTSRQTDAVTITAREILDGVEIKEYYRDKKGATLYALAVLDRIKASRRLEDKATQIKGNLLGEVEAAEKLQNEGRFLPAIGCYNKALAMAIEITSIKELLDVLKLAGPSPFADEVNHEANIKKVIDGLRGKIRFEVKIEGPAANVKSYLIEGLSKAGYITNKATQLKGIQTYRLSGKTDITYRGTIDMGDNMEMQIYKADLALEVEDLSTNETIGALNFSINANEKEQQAAEKAAIQALGRLVRDQVGEKLAGI